MGQLAAGSFACETCGKAYRWKPELAGKKARCKCGAIVLCPENEPGADDDLFEVAPDPHEAKSPPRPVVAAVPVATLAAVPAVQSNTLGYNSAVDQQDKNFPNKVMDLYAPLAIFAASMVVEAIAVMLIAQKVNLPPSVFAGAVVAQLAVIIGCLTVGIFLCAKAYKINLGPLPAAILKVLAISVAPSAAMDLMYVPLHFLPIIGWLLNWLFGFILYFALLGALFDMDQEDTWRCVLTVFFLRIMVALGFALVPMFLHH